MDGTVLVAGIGNIFLGDDGFGSEVVRRMIADDVPVPDSVSLVDYGIRGMHLAYDLLDGCEALVIVDAIPGDGEPGDVRVMAVGVDDVPDGGLDAHGMDPASVLSNLEALGGTMPPTYVVGCQPGDLEERIGLSDAVETAVPVAAQAVVRLIDEHIRGGAVATGRS